MSKSARWIGARNATARHVCFGVTAPPKQNAPERERRQPLLLSSLVRQEPGCRQRREPQMLAAHHSLPREKRSPTSDVHTDGERRHAHEMFVRQSNGQRNMPLRPATSAQERPVKGVRVLPPASRRVYCRRAVIEFMLS